MRVCPNCGYSTDGNDNFCPYCGNPLMEESEPIKEETKTTFVKCPHCGKDVLEYSTFCSHCGKNINEKYDDTFDNYFGQNNAPQEPAAPTRKLNTVRICPKCQTKYNSLLTSCPNCGFSAEDEYYKKASLGREKQEALVYFFICVFFGIIGIIITAAGMKRFKDPGAKKVAIAGIVIGVLTTIVYGIIYIGGLI